MAVKEFLYFQKCLVLFTAYHFKFHLNGFPVLTVCRALSNILKTDHLKYE